jgi:hypothetical protein
MAIALGFATGPCWFHSFSKHRPYPPEPRVIAALRRIQASEAIYQARFHRYGNLLEIDARGVYSRTESSASLSPFRITLKPNGSGYRLTAQFTFRQEGYGCWIGCPECRNFYTDETGILRADSHCHPADASSPPVK